MPGIERPAKHPSRTSIGIKTVRDLGTNKYFLWAQAIAKIAE